jgi:glycosyltransferase involved in cell wall biosynthesis
MPAVTVIVNCLNGETYLREALDSIVAQRYRDWEIIFWDNASSDGSVAIAQSYGEQVRCFRGDRTVPLGRARNLALREARGDFLAFLDCDDVWLPGKLERQMPLFENGRVGLVFSDALIFNERGDVKRMIGDRVVPCGRGAFGAFLSDYRVAMNTVVIRRSVLASFGEWFDERFTMMEDADLFTRIAHDWDVDYVEEPLAKWRMHWDSWSFRRRDLIPLEAEQLLTKYTALYPGFRSEYAAEVAVIQDRIEYETALVEWRRGARGAARRRLVPVCRRKARYWAAYAMSFGPYRLFDTLNQWRLNLGW